MAEAAEPSAVEQSMGKVICGDVADDLAAGLTPKNHDGPHGNDDGVWPA